MKKFLIVTLTFLLAPLCGACGAASKLTPQDESDLSVLTAEVALCHAQAAPVACRAQVKALFDAKMKARFAVDGGAK